jgi:YHS domain-containing protein
MSRRLVRDPVCGAHVAEVLAIPLREGGEVLHFCSIACRDEHLRASAAKNTKKIAANG